MADRKITIARLWQRYEGKPPSRAPIVLGINGKKYRTVCIYLKKSSDAPNFFQQQGLKAYYISSRKYFRVFNALAIVRLVRILRAEKVDILHSHRHQACVYGTIAAHLAGVRSVIAHVHGLNRSVSSRRRFINLFVLPRVRRILTVAETVKQDILRCNPFLDESRIIPVGNSIDYEPFMNTGVDGIAVRRRLGLGADDVVFGTVGRLAPTKGLAYLIEAFGMVKAAIPKAQLLLVGDGRDREVLKRQAGRMQRADSIRFLGRRDDICELLKAMDVFVLASVAEGIPRALLEAMAAGVPCVSTNVGGIPEILCDGRYGMMAPAQDAGALAEAMVRAETLEAGDRDELIAAAQQRIVDEYSHDVVRRRIEGIYDQLCGAGDNE